MFRVRWAMSALNELTNLWVSAGSERRRAITSATQAVDRELAFNPQDKGESRADDDARIFFAPPLGILFQVDQPRAIAHIVRVWTF
jgi:hypothetical protein